jgi:ribonuclease D
MSRPLSQEMIKYASNDTKVLLRLWNKIKSDVNIDLSESIESTIKVYRFPKPKYDCFMEYLKYGGSINYDVWQKMYDWRLKCAKDRDIRLNRFFPLNFSQKYVRICLRTVLNCFKVCLFQEHGMAQYLIHF